MPTFPVQPSMAAPTLRPRSASEIVDAAFQIYRAHFAPFVMCSAIAYVPMLLLQLLVIGDPRRWTDPQAAPDAVYRMFSASMLSFALHWVTLTLMTSVLLVCTSQAYLGETVDVGAAVRRVLPRLVRVLVSSFIRLLFYAVAFMLFLLPVLYVAARYFAVTPAIVLEDATISGSFRRTAELSRGRKWHVLNTLGLASIIYWVIVFGVSMMLALLGSFVLQTIGSAVATMLVYPVVVVSLGLLYYDARIQSEGLDIELMTDALAAPVSPPAPSPAR